MPRNPLDLQAPRYNEPSESDYYVDENAFAQIQRSLYEQPSFFGNHALTSAFTNFKLGLKAAQNYTRTQSNLSASIETKLARVAQSMASTTNISLDVATNFLRILVSINVQTDFNQIVESSGLSGIVDTSLMGNANGILDSRGIETAGYFANALDGILNLFARYLNASRNSFTSNDDASSMITSILGMFNLGSSSSAARLLDAGAIQHKLGNFLSEIITGQRIPVPVIAQNPMKESPSYIGKVFFGELRGLMSHVDVTNLFPKKLAVFPKSSNGAGMTSFNFQNLASFGGAMDLSSAINTMNFGTTEISAGSHLSDLAATQLSQVQSMLGASNGEKIELTRADNAIPFMMSMSAVHSGQDNSPFPTSTFTEGWSLASSVTQFLSIDQTDFLRTIRGLE